MDIFYLLTSLLYAGERLDKWYDNNRFHFFPLRIYLVNEKIKDLTKISALAEIKKSRECDLTATTIYGRIRKFLLITIFFCVKKKYQNWSLFFGSVIIQLFHFQ